MTGNEVAAHEGVIVHHEDVPNDVVAHDEHEEVTSPDQHRRTVSGRKARLGAIVTILVLPFMALIGNHEGGIEKIILIGISGLLLLMLIIDFFLRRAGLRPSP